MTFYTKIELEKILQYYKERAHSLSRREKAVVKDLPQLMKDHRIAIAAGLYTGPECATWDQLIQYEAEATNLRNLVNNQFELPDDSGVLQKFELPDDSGFDTPPIHQGDAKRRDLPRRRRVW